MLKVFGLLFFILSFYCCKIKNGRTISIWIENNSAINKNIEVATYLDDSMVDKRNIMKDSIADRVLPFKIELKTSTIDRKYRFRFVLPSYQEEVNCIAYEDSLKEATLLHVNYVEKIYKRGSHFENVTLNNDSIYDKRFYCEVLYHPSRPD